MLAELHIANLAVIERARIELADGLNVFTGSTGAGKSLVLGAIELLLGLRSGADMVRAGCEEARVDGLFHIADPALLDRIAQLTADRPVDGQILLTRRLLATGRSSHAINGRAATAAMVRELGELLIDIHGQHDHQLLLRPAAQLALLDSYARVDTPEDHAPLARYRVAFREWQQTRTYIDGLAAQATRRAREIELLSFQLQELDAARLEPDEHERLRERAQRLEHAVALKRAALAAAAALTEGEQPVTDQLAMIQTMLSDAARLDPQAAVLKQRLDAAAVELAELARDLDRYADGIEDDPELREQTRERLDLLNHLTARHGTDLAGLIDLSEGLRSELETLLRQDQDHAHADDLLARRRSLVDELAGQITTMRRTAGEQLAELVHRELADLGLPHARLSPHFTLLDEPGPGGLETLEMLFAPNPGQPPRPLRKIASGGELSRVMLGLKGILAQEDRVSVLIFDEIDSNVGGRLGSVIAGKLRALSRRHQVLCITHLPQIAAFADCHHRVTKQAGEQTLTTVEPLQGERRVAELAEMISGVAVTQTTLQQAREMLEQAEQPAGSPVQCSASPAAHVEPASVAAVQEPAPQHGRSTRARKPRR